MPTDDQGRAELTAWKLVAHRLAAALTMMRTGEASPYEPPYSAPGEPIALPMDAYDALDEYERLVSSSVVSGESDAAESDQVGRLSDEAAWVVVKALREYAVNGLDIADTNPEDEATLRREAEIADDVIARLGGDAGG